MSSVGDNLPKSTGDDSPNSTGEAFSDCTGKNFKLHWGYFVFCRGIFLYSVGEYQDLLVLMVDKLYLGRAVDLFIVASLRYGKLPLMSYSMGSEGILVTFFN